MRHNTLINHSVFRAAVLGTFLGTVGCQGHIEIPANEEFLINTSNENSLKPLSQGEMLDQLREGCSEAEHSARALVRLSAAQLKSRWSKALPLSASQIAMELPADSVGALGFYAGLDAISHEIFVERTETIALQLAEESLENGELQDMVNCVSNELSEPCGMQLADTLSNALRWSSWDDERSSYESLFSEMLKENPDYAYRGLVGVMLSSPHSLYREDIGIEGKLTSREVANKLAYVYASESPDDALWSLALQNELSSPDVLITEARRLLNSESGAQHLAAIARDWLHYDKLLTAVRESDVDAFTNLRLPYVESMDRFVFQKITAQQSTIGELFSGTPEGSLDSSLLSYLSDEQNPQIKRDVGLLSHPAMLAAQAAPTRSSPTLRGLAVYEHLLCQPKLSPPPGVATEFQTIDVNAITTRQLFEENHAAQPACSSCHQIFDPIGYAFEHFDELGRSRANERGLAIDVSGSVLLLNENFDNSDGLSTILSNSSEVGSCVSGLWSKAFLGGDSASSCLSPTARDAVTQGQISLQEFLVEQAASPGFISVI